MPLTKLIINGFKSFPDRTEIDFGDGITAVVGPNGSGKSNITEAIRWAMGESSAKSLRGSSMKDVIFAGSQFRPAMNHAEVSLVFDNKNRELHLNSDRVMVTRSILRSGDSKYEINHKSVRMKDLRSLFLDSGISQNSLAIISQGRVDLILNSKPEERRVIFEEAAGVLHFKQQKEIAQRQLTKTDANLVRINDLVKELENRLGPLQKQSSLAKQHRFEQKRLDNSLKVLLAFEAQVLNEKRASLQTEAENKQAILDKLDGQVKSAQDRLLANRKRSQQLTNDKNKIQDKITSISQLFSDLQTKTEVAQQSEHYDQATRHEYELQEQEISRQLSALKQQAKNNELDIKKFSLKGQKLNKNKAALVKKLREDPTSLRNKIASSRNQYIELLQKQTANNNQRTYLSGELKRLRDSAANKQNFAEELERAKKALANIGNQGQHLKKQLEKEQEEISSGQENWQKINDRKKICQDQLERVRRKLQGQAARREALKNIKKRHEGYYYGVRNILNHKEDFAGIVGVIAELISFPVELEHALSTALGGAAQDLVAERRKDARNAIQRLKNRHAGRATFLPLDGLRFRLPPRSTMLSLRQIKGFKGVASSLVKPAASVDISPAINYLLGNVLIADNIDTAMLLHERVRRYRIVTLDGDVISPGGSMSGGARSYRGNSPLQLTAEIGSLNLAINSQRDKEQQLQKRLVFLSSTESDLTASIEGQKQSLNDLETKISTAAVSYQNQEKEVRRLADARNLFLKEEKTRGKKINSLVKELEQNKGEANSISAGLGKARKQIASLQSQLRSANESNKSLQSKLAKTESQIAVIDNQLQNARRRASEKEDEIAAEKKQLSLLAKKITGLAGKRQKRQTDRQQNGSRLNQLKKQKSFYQEKLTAVNKDLGKLNGKIDQLQSVATRNYDLRKDAAAEQETFSVKITQLQSKINSRLDELSSKYSLTFEAAVKQAKLENNKDNRRQLAKSIKLRRMSLADIGPVNMQSIDEYQQVKKRYDFLHGQQNDLLQARDDLHQSMADLDQEVRNRFSNTFGKVNASFSKLFPQVFAGGSAKLVLTQPDNLLETGVEIIARPPGKKLARLSLLSGGERALTAITLLFAILKVNPVPFCVLDEVEAALDDVNVNRFARFLRRFDLATQFIVITHRQGTMEQADQLYGVVMQESGVSQVLSVSLKEMKNEVKR